MLNRKRHAVWFATACVVATLGLTWAQADEFEVGGPMEGPKLKLFPTHHGEKPGYPGTASDADPTKNRGVQGQWPQYQLYDGSVENWRSYWGKYVPVRSMVDAGSLLHVWAAPKIPAAGALPAEKYEAPIFWVPRHNTPVDTGLRAPAVDVTRWEPGSPPFQINAELPVGMYVVRIVGAVEQSFLLPNRAPLFISAYINDGPEGAETRYRLRAGYCEEIYSVADFYFHANEKRAYSIRLVNDSDSTVPLLVQCVDLHNALAGIDRKPVKERATLTSEEDRKQLRAQKLADPANAKLKFATTIADMDARLKADQAIWESFAPMNAQMGGIYGLNKGYGELVNHGALGKTLAEIDAEFGSWTNASRYDGLSERKLIVNEKLKLEYTTLDLAQHKPLPDPFPIKDIGTGVATPPKPKPETGPAATQPAPVQQEYAPIADAVVYRINQYYRSASANSMRYQELGDAEAGWNAAMAICRIAYQYPSIDGTQALSAHISCPGGFQREMRNRRRDPSVSPGGGNGMAVDQLPEVYDRVFDVVKDNEAFTKSLGRFIPWVKSPKDVVMLLDVYLVQYQAKQVLRYNLMFDNYPAWIVKLATVEGDRKTTDPWLKWLFAKAYIYPNRPAGMGDTVTNGYDRDGMGYIASWNYCAGGENAIRPGHYMDQYVAAGGDPKYDLTDPAKYPKVAASAKWTSYGSRIAGLHFARIGDVGGPDKDYGSLFETTIAAARVGWKWNNDPKQAYIIKNYLGRSEENDDEWARIEAAAAKVSRAPWLDNKSRYSANWFTLLEGGTQFDDFRFRSSAMLRTGLGYGHAHSDSLDLEITALGLPITICSGQRPGYNKPNCVTTRIHNMVEIDGKDWLGYSWANTLADNTGAPFTRAQATPPGSHSSVALNSRAISLIEVDQGSGYKPLTAAQQVPKKTPIDKAIVSPKVYVFDVVRVSGGTMHTYCFHGPLEDEFKLNLPDPTPYEKLPAPELEYLKIFPDHPIENYFTSPMKIGGDSPPTLEATWRMAIEVPGNGLGEKEIAPGWYEGAPRKFTRLHLLGQEKSRAFTGWSWSRQNNWGINCLMSQRRAEQPIESVFPAIIEPFAGEPFITTTELKAIKDNEADALRAVAVNVVTTTGHHDLCFTDGRPDKTRQIGDIKIAGEFAFLSTDAKGVRQATLTGGTVLEAPGITLRAATRERTGKVIGVDYHHMQLTIDQRWPSGELLHDTLFELGSDTHMTAYQINGLATDDKGHTTISVQGSPALFASRVTDFDPKTGLIHTPLGMPQFSEPVNGLNRRLHASNDEGNKHWLVDYHGQTSDEELFYTFKAVNPIDEKDIQPGSGLRVWDYGVGDSVRQSTRASLRRDAENVFTIEATVDVTLALGKSAIELSVDGTTYTPLKPNADSTVSIRLADLSPRGKAWLRVK